MGIKYIKNIDDATIVCRITSDKKKVFVFPMHKINKRENTVVSNGFTAISEEDLALLKAESSTFQFYEKSGKLTLADELPQESMSPEQLIAVLRDEIDMLKAEISVLKEGNTPDSSKELNEAHLSITVLTDELNESKALLEEKDKMIEALDAQLLEMSELVAAQPEAEEQK
jgi:uncharacterized small protein (DUF1192 family)